MFCAFVARIWKNMFSLFCAFVARLWKNMFCLFWLNTYHQFRYLHCVFHVCRGKQAKIRQQKKRQHAKTLLYNATLMEEELRHDNAVIPDAPPAPPPCEKHVGSQGPLRRLARSA